MLIIGMRYDQLGKDRLQGCNLRVLVYYFGVYYIRMFLEYFRKFYIMRSVQIKQLMSSIEIGNFGILGKL